MKELKELVFHSVADGFRLPEEPNFDTFNRLVVKLPRDNSEGSKTHIKRDLSQQERTITEEKPSVSRSSHSKAQIEKSGETDPLLEDAHRFIDLERIRKEGQGSDKLFEMMEIKDSTFSECLSKMIFRSLYEQSLAQQVNKLDEERQQEEEREDAVA